MAKKPTPKRKNAYLYPALTLVMCHLLFMFLSKSGVFMHTSIGQHNFLALHTVLEFLSVLFSLQYYANFPCIPAKPRLRHLVPPAHFSGAGYLPHAVQGYAGLFRPQQRCNAYNLFGDCPPCYGDWLSLGRINKTRQGSPNIPLVFACLVPGGIGFILLYCNL